MVEETGSQAKTGLGMRRLVGRIIIIFLVILCLSVDKRRLKMPTLKRMRCKFFSKGLGKVKETPLSNTGFSSVFGAEWQHFLQSRLRNQLVKNHLVQWADYQENQEIFITVLAHTLSSSSFCFFFILCSCRCLLVHPDHYLAVCVCLSAALSSASACTAAAVAFSSPGNAGRQAGKQGSMEWQSAQSQLLIGGKIEAKPGGRSE